MVLLNMAIPMIFQIYNLVFEASIELKSVQLTKKSFVKWRKRVSFPALIEMTSINLEWYKCLNFPMKKLTIVLTFRKLRAFLYQDTLTIKIWKNILKT